MNKLLSLLLFAGILASCDEAKEQTFDLDIPEVKLSYEDLSESKTVSFTAAHPWEAKIADKTRSSSWLSIEPMSGPAGKTTLTITITEANTGADPRSAEVTITSGGVPKTFTVTQHSESSQNGGGNTDDYYVDPEENTCSFTSGASTQTVSVKSNFDFTVTETYGQGDAGGWLTTNVTKPVSGSDDYALAVHVSENTSGAERTATLMFQDKDGKSYAQIAVVQAAGGGTSGGNIVMETPVFLSFIAAGQYRILRANSPAPITIEYVGDHNWFTVETRYEGDGIGQESGRYYYRQSVVAEVNNTGKQREAFVNLKSGGQTKQIRLVQFYVGQPMDETQVVQVTNHSGFVIDIPATNPSGIGDSIQAFYMYTTSFIPNAEMHFGGYTNPGDPGGWFTFMSGAPEPGAPDGYNNKLFKWNVAPNTTGAPRTATVYFYDADDPANGVGGNYNMVSYRFQITQAAADSLDYKIAFRDGSQLFRFPLQSPGTITVELIVPAPGTTVTCENKNDWFQVALSQSETDSRVYNVTVACLPGIQKRTGHFTLTGTLNGVQMSMNADVEQGN